MSKHLAGVCAIAALLAGATGAAAADLAGDPYDDPRYAEIYRDAPPPPPPVAGRYEERYERKEYRYEGRENGYGHPPPPPPPPYARGPDYAGDEEGCLPRHVIRRRLIAEGWHDFHALEYRGRFALVTARRPSGREFDLKIDRCSGHIVHARPLDAPDYDRYAYGSRRYWRY